MYIHYSIRRAPVPYQGGCRRNTQKEPGPRKARGERSRRREDVQDQLHFEKAGPDPSLWDKEKYLHWFGLTDGLLWIRAGDSVIYEYASPHEGDFGESVRYNDYQLSRFAEDLPALTPVIPESLPEELYGAAETMDRDLKEWNSLYADLRGDAYDRFLEEAYEPLSEWYCGVL